VDFERIWGFLERKGIWGGFSGDFEEKLFPFLSKCVSRFLFLKGGLRFHKRKLWDRDF